MKQLIVSHLFALLPIDYFKVIIFINWHMASPNYDSFWPNSSLWLHKYSIADEKVYLQGWMLSRSTIKSITILSPLTIDKIVQKKKYRLEIVGMVTIQKWVNLDIFTSPNIGGALQGPTCFVTM